MPDPQLQHRTPKIGRVLLTFGLLVCAVAFVPSNERELLFPSDILPSGLVAQAIAPSTFGVMAAVGGQSQGIDSATRRIFGGQPLGLPFSRKQMPQGAQSGPLGNKDAATQQFSANGPGPTATGLGGNAAASGGSSLSNGSGVPSPSSPNGSQPVFGRIPSLGGGGSFDTDPIISGVPEPSSWLLMILGIGAIGGILRGRRNTLKLA